MEMTVVGAEQPDLVSDVSPGRRAEAIDATRAATLRIRAGPWAADELRGPPGHLGLLMLGGLLSREVVVGHRRHVELLGDGDLLRPWDASAGEASSWADTRWTVHRDLRVAVLDRAFALRIGSFPEITAALMGRVVRRSQSLAFHLAVGHLPQLEARLRLTFWDMADRWGHVTPAGVVVPVRLSHELLGGLVGAHRSPVTRALGRLRTAGELVRLPDGSWLLLGEQPDELAQMRVHAWCS